MSHGIQEEKEVLEEEGVREGRQGIPEEEVHRVPQGRPQRAQPSSRRSSASGMSAFIGNVKGPHHNSPNEAASVWCSPGNVEVTVVGDQGDPDYAPGTVRRSLDPITARNLAALLVRASEEAERMSARAAFRARQDEGVPK